MENNAIRDYSYADSLPTYANAYLWPALQRFVADRNLSDKRAFDLGCGNGASANMLAGLGFSVAGVDPSHTGVAQAQRAFPHLRIEAGSAYDDLRARFGQFPLVVSLEVVEHCLYPRLFAKTCFDLLEDGGVLFLSTPYHGYLKNLALSVAGKWDSHHGPLWEGGHVKFFSIKTLRQLLVNAGFKDIEFLRIGRIPTFAKSMVAIAHKR